MVVFGHGDLTKLIKHFMVVFGIAIEYTWSRVFRDDGFIAQDSTTDKSVKTVGCCPALHHKLHNVDRFFKHTHLSLMMHNF
jgi:hypothetical protein